MATRVEIDLGAIAHNIQQISQKVKDNARIMAVVKADGYGHGAVEVARVALKNGVDFLAVSSPEEGIKLREAKINAPILILSPSLPESAEVIVKYDLIQTVCTEDLAIALSTEAQKFSKVIKIHVKIDTGMGRIGVFPEDAGRFIKRISKLKGIKVEGIFTHFSEADKKDKTFTLSQINKFKKVVDSLEREGMFIPLKHMANSAAVLDLPSSYLNLVRPGIIIYGLYPSGEVTKTVNLKPAMSFKTHVVYIKTFPAGTYIGYRRSFTTKRKSTIAVLPVGYTDGYSRALSNRGQVLIKGKRAPVVGKICMNITLIDVSHIPGVKVGDEVVLFGEQGNNAISVDEIASIVNTLNYEIICTVGNCAPRVYIR
ncbi:alanine racemase [Candidatus Aerophobetes bacterium]|nr:alanine racemase [Candidatus Aerophobetes bacterium]